jgi:hypothetical protein
VSDLAPGTPAQLFQARLLPTVAVAAVIAVVVLGGLGLDGALAAPSAGTLDIGASVTITAAPGWVLDAAAEGTTSGVQLRKADAILTAQVIDQTYSGDSASIIDDAEKELTGTTAQISFGDAHHSSINGHDTTYVSFQATITTSARSGVVDGEVIAMAVGRDATLFELAAPQGRLGPAVDDVTAMLASVKVGR